jgi:hypothetical protein
VTNLRLPLTSLFMKHNTAKPCPSGRLPVLSVLLLRDKSQIASAVVQPIEIDVIADFS